MNTQPRFSVIIPVCHGGTYLERVLRTLSAVKYAAPEVETLVAGYHEDEAARQCVEGAAATSPFNLRWVEASSMSRVDALNAAVAVSHGEILVFTDDDCVLPPDWLTQLDRAFCSDKEIGCLGGVDVHTSDEGPFGEALDWLLNAPVGSGGSRKPAPFSPAEYYPRLWNMAIARVAANAVSEGGLLFNPHLEVHEDVELVRRVRDAGYAVRQATAVRVRHARDTTWQRFLLRNFRMARAARRIGVHRLPHLALSGLVLGLSCGPAIAVLPRPVGVAWLAVVAVYALVVATSAVLAGARKRSLQVAAWIPLLLVGVHFMRGLGYMMPLSSTDAMAHGG